MFLFIQELLKCVTVSTKILCSTTVFNIENKKKYILSSKSANKRMISEGSCDMEDWNNDALTIKNN